jgi:ABC-type sugar transport system ATPase subunit
MIYVTHDQVEAMTLADRIVVLGAVLNKSVRLWSFITDLTDQFFGQRLRS